MTAGRRRKAHWDNHVVLTLGRSGSNTLVDMLNQHPAVLNYGELLGEWNMLRKIQRRFGLFRGDDAAYLERLLTDPALMRVINVGRGMIKLRKRRWSERKRLSDLRSVGFKDFDLNFRKYGLTDWLPGAVADGGMKVIGLTRQNTLSRLVSTELLAATGIAGLRDEPADSDGKRQVSLDPTTILDRLDEIGVENADLVQSLDALPAESVIRLDYDDLYSSDERTERAMKRVFAFLGLPPISAQTRMIRLGSTDPLDAVTNADEIREILLASKHASFLDRAE